MPADRSCIMVIPDANRAHANKVLARVFGDPPSSNNLSVGLNASGSGVATHWCNHIYRDEAQATVLLNLVLGVLPTFNDGLSWADFGITQLQATNAVLAMATHVTTDNDLPTNFLAGILSARNLKVIQAEI